MMGPMSRNIQRLGLEGVSWNIQGPGRDKMERL